MARRIATAWRVKERWQRLARLAWYAGFLIGLLPSAMALAAYEPRAVLRSPLWLLLTIALPPALAWLARRFVGGIGRRRVVRADHSLRT